MPTLLDLNVRGHVREGFAPFVCGEAPELGSGRPHDAPTLIPSGADQWLLRVRLSDDFDSATAVRRLRTGVRSLAPEDFRLGAQLLPSPPGLRLEVHAKTLTVRPVTLHYYSPWRRAQVRVRHAGGETVLPMTKDGSGPAPEEVCWVAEIPGELCVGDWGFVVEGPGALRDEPTDTSPGEGYRPRGASVHLRGRRDLRRAASTSATRSPSGVADRAEPRTGPRVRRAPRAAPGLRCAEWLVPGGAPQRRAEPDLGTRTVRRLAHRHDSGVADQARPDAGEHPCCRRDASGPQPGVSAPRRPRRRSRAGGHLHGLPGRPPPAAVGGSPPRGHPRGNDDHRSLQRRDSRPARRAARPGVIHPCRLPVVALLQPDVNRALLAQTDSPLPERVYLDSGTRWAPEDGAQDSDDNSLVTTWALRDDFLTRGLVLEQDVRHVLAYGDAHNETAWQRRVAGCIEFLLHPE